VDQGAAERGALLHAARELVGIFIVEAFKADEAGYLKKYKLSPEQTDAILKREWNRMLELGGNIYFTAKLGATDGLSFQQMAAKMTGCTQQEYADMMLAGGRSPNGARTKSEWKK
jgi:protocatechuate 4,5-dioxygenase alpha chain